jgi:hypothetical protein
MLCATGRSFSVLFARRTQFFRARHFAIVRRHNIQKNLLLTGVGKANARRLTRSRGFSVIKGD